MASSSSSGSLKLVADLPSSCSSASHHPLQFITDVGLTASHAESKVSPGRQAGRSPRAEVIMEPEINLPEDILWKIHALMQMQDAARAACLSRGFLHSWRCYPKLISDMRALGKQTRDFINRVDHIMRNHSGVGMETFKLQTRNDFNVHPSYLDRWLQVAITPGIKEFVLGLPINNKMKYNFPGSLLSREAAHSIQYFHLNSCAFHSVDKVGCLSNLKTVCLHDVGITGEELCLLLSNSFVLEHLDLEFCCNIHCLKIPHLLSKLNTLEVQCCKMLEMIKCSAPNVSIFNYDGPPIHISLGGSLQVKKMQMTCAIVPNLLHYASTKLLSIAPNVQILFLHSLYETVNTPMVLGKFPHLKYLEIKLFMPGRSPVYDFCSLVSFLDASPTLKTFVLCVEAPIMECALIPGVNVGEDSSLASCVQKHRHRKLRSVIITGFCPWKTMIELTRCILARPNLAAARLPCRSRGRPGSKPSRRQQPPCRSFLPSPPPAGVVGLSPCGSAAAGSSPPSAGMGRRGLFHFGRRSAGRALARVLALGAVQRGGADGAASRVVQRPSFGGGGRSSSGGAAQAWGAAARRHGLAAVAAGRTWCRPLLGRRQDLV